MLGEILGQDEGVILVHPLSRPLSIWEAFAGEKRKGVGNDAIKITRLRLVLDTLQCESFARPFYLVNFFQPISINSVSADRVLQPTFGAWGCRSLSGLACALSVWGPIAIQIKYVTAPKFPNSSPPRISPPVPLRRQQ